MAGAHDLLCAAFEMGDDSAERALAMVDVTPKDWAATLASLEADTLSELGIDVPDLATEPATRSRTGNTDATYEAAIRATHDTHRDVGDRLPLQSAHILAGVASVGHGVSARVFEAMGLDREAVMAASREILAGSGGGG